MYPCTVRHLLLDEDTFRILKRILKRQTEIQLKNLQVPKSGTSVFLL